jgi:acetyltransferase-like isoleucine patch superfamily enzyme
MQLKKVISKLRNRLFEVLYANANPSAYARSIGVRVGQHCKLISIKRSSFGSEPYLISLGDNVEVTGEVRFITHDGGAWVFREELPDVDVFGEIQVGNNVFIGFRSTILPGTVIGDNCVIGACSLVRGRLESGGVYAGVPARFICSLDDYKKRLVKRSLNTKRMKPEEKRRVIRDHFSMHG